MSQELMIPEASDVPAYILNPELAKKANEDAMSGISTGAHARIKLSGKQFVLVDGNGEETSVKAKDMIEAADGNMYLPVIVLRAKREIQKAWYAEKYNPKNEEAKTPDCFSNDGVKPDPSAPSPQCDTCANCPMNAFGSGTDQNGNATGGKACADNKILAVFVPKVGIHKLKIPPASLKNFGLYLKQLSARGIPVGNVKTLIGFDERATFPVITFQFGGFLPEKLLPQLADMAQSQEAEEIAADIITPSSKSAPKIEKKAEPKKEEPESEDLGLDTPKEEPEKASEVTVEVSDDDLAKELGL